MKIKYFVYCGNFRGAEYPTYDAGLAAARRLTNYTGKHWIIKQVLVK